jgi:hypothetical protein
MPTWLILTIAALVLVAGALSPTIRARRARTTGFREQLATARAEVGAVRDRIDTSPPDVDVEQAADAAATAEALLSAARPAQSVAICRQVDALMDQARRSLDRAEGRGERA